MKKNPVYNTFSMHAAQHLLLSNSNYRDSEDLQHYKNIFVRYEKINQYRLIPIYGPLGVTTHKHDLSTYCQVVLLFRAIW